LLSATVEELWALQKHELVAAVAELQKEVKRPQSHLVDDTHLGAVRVETACQRLLGKLGARPVPLVWDSSEWTIE
jgi:type II secretory pathway predicted ATPase ExeA